MAIYECLVASTHDLARPGGCAFDPPCTTQEEDQKAWESRLPNLESQIRLGRVIMAIIQARNSRPWSDEGNNYAFKAPEDYLVAAYCLSRELGNPYSPGTVLDLFVNQILQEGTRPMDSRIETPQDKAAGHAMFPTPIPGQIVEGARNTKEMYLAFRCSDKGVKFTRQGAFKKLEQTEKSGAGFAEQITFVKQLLADGQKFGWKGGAFPRW